MESMIVRGGIIGENSFREYVNVVLYVKSKVLLRKFYRTLNIRADDEGLVMMGYIDPEEGICFDVFCSAYMHRGAIKCNDTYTGSEGIIHIEEMKGMEYIVLAGLPGRKSLIEKSNEVVKRTDTPEQRALLEARKIKGLDPARNFVHPDNVYVPLYKKDHELELVWVKCLHTEENAIVCRLLDDPKDDFGVHEGDEVSLGYIRVSGDSVPFWGCWIKEK